MIGVNLSLLSAISNTSNSGFSGGDGSTMIPTADNWFQDTGVFTLSGSSPNTYTFHDTLSRILLYTSATSLDIEAVPITSNYSSGYITIYVNNVYNQTVQYSGTIGVRAIVTVTLPAGTNKLIEIEENAYVTGIKGIFTGTWRNSPIARTVAYGDSISCRGFVANSSAFGFTDLLRHDGFTSWTFYGSSGRRLNDDYLLDNSMMATAQALVTRCDGSLLNTVFITIGTNDYAGTSGTIWSAANFGSAYAALLSAIHTLNSNIKIVCMSPVIRSPETANTFGDNLDAYRTQISNAVSARSSYCTYINGTSVLSIGNLAVDGLHPNNTGHQEMHDNLRTSLGWTGLSLSGSAPTATASISLTVTNPITDPSTLPNIFAWWNPEITFTGVANNTSEQTMINLISGQTAWDLTQATSGSRPLVKTGTSPNAKRGLRFDGVDDYYRQSGSPTLVGLPRHIFATLKCITGTTSGVILDGAVNQSNWLIQGNPTLGIGMSAGNYRTGFGPDHTGFVLVEMLFKAGSLSTLIINQTSVLAAGDSGSANLTGFTLGATGGTAGFFSNVEFYDIFICSQELTGSSLASARTYMATV